MSRASAPFRESEMRAVLRAHAAGGLPADIALMRLVLLSEGDDELASFLEAPEEGSDGDGQARLAGLRELARRQRSGWAVARATAAAVPHDEALPVDAAAALKRLAGHFDAAARVSPEASVALYSLGDPARLALATAEIAGWMAERDLLGAGRTLLDLGCGIGRLEEALHGRVGHVVGCDISGEMIAEARRRCASLGNVAFRHTDGLGLGPFGDAAFDAVVAVDVFPYLVQAGGLAARHFNEAARVLKEGGRLAILNYSYRGTPGQDREDVRRLGGGAGLIEVESGAQPFRLWDGTAFLLRKEAAGTVQRGPKSSAAQTVLSMPPSTK